MLGVGGVGEVTLVRDNDIDRPVALKRLRVDAKSAPCIDRFVREIRTVGQLEHPNITPIHDVGVDDAGEHYFVMRYIEGETLDAIIRKLADGDPEYHRRYPFAERAQIFLGVLHAIEYAHSKGILHCDIKPSNIMVGRYGEVFMMDWGIATPRSRASEASLIGTPAYMSPEQAAPNRTIDERSDIYSLCVVFYELLTLQYYLPGHATPSELFAAIGTQRQRLAMRVLSKHQPPVPVELAWFVDKGLAKNPDERYPSVSEMVGELQRVRSGRFPIKCQISFVKWFAGLGSRLVDLYPPIGFVTTVLVLALFGFAIVQLARIIVG